MTTQPSPPSSTAPDERTYRRRVRAWTLYDWANSAYATVILGAVLPVYYSQVAGATLPDQNTATQYWGLGLSLSLFIGALLTPLLGTISDVMRGKKVFLSIFTLIGVVCAGLLVLVERGDWLLASLLFVVGRIGFIGAITFYDSLLPHVARPDDQDRISTQGYALGYLGGGLLLAFCLYLIAVLPGTLGPRLSFVLVAIWWLVFSLPILRQVPEPPSATEQIDPGETVIGESLKRLRATFRDIQRYRELFKFLIAFLIYNDAINTIINLATIYGAELGFGTLELVSALLLVQFIGIPFSLIFGSLPNPASPRRPIFLALILYNTVMLPLVGIAARFLMPVAVSGAQQAQFAIVTTLPGGGTIIGLEMVILRENNVLPILGLMLAVEIVGVVLASLFGRRLCSGLVQRLDTQRSILLALAVYSVIAAWGFFLDSTVEYFLLGLMVAMVQGGSQALSRSLFARMSPRVKSGEFFGFYGVMEKFAAIIGPMVFVIFGALFGDSRPSIIAMVVFFAIGGWLLMRVDVEAGKRVAAEEDARLLNTS